MSDPAVIEGIRRKFEALNPVLDERSRRPWATVETTELGWGGVSAVAVATGLSRTTVTSGIQELRDRSKTPVAKTTSRVRRLGAGRKPITESDPQFRDALETLAEAVTRVDPQSPLLPRQDGNRSGDVTVRYTGIMPLAHSFGQWSGIHRPGDRASRGAQRSGDAVH